ncbi:cytochrome-c peroxidase [Lishizhenia sp.]|uniref:cytochrome-c peroxidase n=1 Tax=Lishizhenia sp. TaxID=2497594 RepID=UPI00299CF42C|nr:cytochrome c peroxidase [Lishizhenia sp.]MDX1445024.1 cytochrome c peroxidase [Lishizhenia sp.]
MKQAFFFVLLSLLVFSCKEEVVSYSPTPYVLKEPSHFPKMDIPADNPMTKEGVKLGRHLFYEERLSGDNTMSCASCHAPNLSFSDGEVTSTGIDGIAGNRNSMALVNLGYQHFFFWDGRSKTLEEQILEPVPNPIEMHESWTNAVLKLKDDVKYNAMFFEAFGTYEYDSTHVAKAVAQFIRTMISGNAEYDILYKVENGIALSDAETVRYNAITNQELEGYELFKSLNGADCIHCHSGPMAQIEGLRNNGLDATFTDLGRAEVTGDANDEGKFKVPTLRNIALTAPYMHDGRFATLEEVIDHYSTGIQQSPTLDPMIEFAFQGGVQLDEYEKNAVLAFLHCLTDSSFITNPAFSDPE